MSLDDRAADRQAYPHAVALRGEERIEDLLDVFWIYLGRYCQLMSRISLLAPAFDP